MEQTAEDVASQEIDWAGIIAEEDAKLKSKARSIASWIPEKPLKPKPLKPVNPTP